MKISDIDEKYGSIKIQNKELKEIMLKKENEINNLKAQNAKLENDLNALLDPLSATSMLKNKYKEKLKKKKKL